MNLIQQAEELKNVPDSALSQLSQGQGMVPPYLVMSEMKRREQMRKAYTSQKGGDPVQRKTVMEEMKERFNPSAPPSPDQQGQPGQPQQMAPNAPVRMAKGGLASVDKFVSRLGGGTPYPMEPEQMDPEVDPLSGLPLNSQQMPQMYANQSFTPDDAPLMPHELAITQKQMDSRYGASADAEAGMRKFLESRKGTRLDGVAAQLAAMEQQARGKKADIGQILMNLGLGMAASRRPDWAGAIGEGGINAMQGYAHQKQQNQAQADNFMKQRLGVLESQQQSDDVATRSGDDYLRALIAAQNTNKATGEASIRSMQHGDLTERMNELNRKTQMDVAGVNERGAQARHAADAAARSADKAREMEWEKSKLEREIKAGKFSHPPHAPKDSDAGMYHLITANTGIIQANEREIIELQKELADLGPSPKGVPDPKRSLIVDRIQRLRGHNDEVRGELGEISAKIKGIPVLAPPPRPQATPMPPRKGGLNGLNGLIGASDLFAK